MESYGERSGIQAGSGRREGRDERKIRKRYGTGGGVRERQQRERGDMAGRQDETGGRRAA